jgi:hypothetical protein
MAYFYCSTFFRSLVSQYLWTVTGVGLATSYGILQRPGPKTGVGIMLVAGAGGSLMDMVYGYFVTCQPHVQAIRELEQQSKSPRQN